MASDREIQRVRKDPQEWRLLVGRLLIYADHGALPDKDETYLDSLTRRPWLEELNYRQAEWLLDIRDRVQTVSNYRGFSLKTLISNCHQNRFGLDDDEDQVWLEELKASGRSALNTYETRRLYALAIGLGLIDPH